jgi:hypothetical protein
VKAKVVILLLAVATLLTACGTTDPRGGPPEQLVDDAAFQARQMGQGSPAWAAFVPVTLEQAKTVLGSKAERLDEVVGNPDEMYLVVLKGEFVGGRFTGVGGSGPYLTFVSARNDETWTASHYVISELPPATEQLADGLIRFDLPATADPTIAAIRDWTVMIAVWFLLPLMLIAAVAVLIRWPEHSWPRYVALSAAAVAAGAQIVLFALSVRGVHDARFVIIKAAILGVVLLVDAAAAVAGLLSGRHRWRNAAIALLLAAAALYLLALPYLSTTGE